MTSPLVSVEKSTTIANHNMIWEHVAFGGSGKKGTMWEWLQNQ